MTTAKYISSCVLRLGTAQRHKRAVRKKRKFIRCQYQYTIQVNLRFPIFYDDQTLFVGALAKQGKKLQGKVKILISYACVSGSYRSYRRACWSYSQKS